MTPTTPRRPARNPAPRRPPTPTHRQRAERAVRQARALGISLDRYAVPFTPAGLAAAERQIVARERAGAAPRRNPTARRRPSKTARRNPAKRRPAPSHDLFGERQGQRDMFGGTVYVPVPVATRSAEERKREQKRRAGQLGLDIGGTRGMFD